MHRNSIATFAVAGLAAFEVAPALAGEPLPPGVPNWTGFYFGGAAGFKRQSVEYLNPVFEGEVNPTGFYGGGFLGYNYHFSPQFLVGGEFGGGFTSLDDTSRIGGTDLRTETPWEGHAIIRVGVLVNPQTLIYAGGGFTFAKHEVSFPTLSESFSRGGFTVRGGVEFGRLINGVHVGFEYSYSDFGKRTFFGDLPVDLSQHAAMFRISSVPAK